MSSNDGTPYIYLRIANNNLKLLKKDLRQFILNDFMLNRSDPADVKINKSAKVAIL